MFVLVLVVLLLPNAQACGGNFTQTSGSFESPNYPNYTSSLDCAYLIKGKPGERITLTFEQFDIQGLNGSCNREFMEIRNGDSAGSTFWLRCNVPSTGYQKRSFQSSMYIRFYTDNSQTGIRFRLSYTAATMKDDFLIIPISDTTNAGKILLMDEDTTSVITIPSLNILTPTGVDFDPVERRLYWIDTGFDAINSAYVNGSDQRTLRILSKNSFARGIAVDPVSRLVFYTDYINGVIGMMTMSGSLHRTVIPTTGLDRPRAIALDIRNGVMYWCEWNETLARIKRANYDGTDRRVIASALLGAPNALALDVSNDLMYWVDGDTGKVEVSDLNGNMRTTLYTMPPGSTLFGLANSNQHLFAIDLNYTPGFQVNESDVWRLSKDGRFREWILTVSYKINDIHVYEEDGWQRGPNGCNTNNGGCSHFCIPLPGNTFKCVCPDAPTNCVDVVKTTAVPDGGPSVGVTVGAVGGPSVGVTVGAVGGVDSGTVGGAVGGAVGGCVVIIIVVIVVVVITRKRETSKRHKPSAPGQSAEVQQGQQRVVDFLDLRENPSQLVASDVSSPYDDILILENGESAPVDYHTPINLPGSFNNQAYSGSNKSYLQLVESTRPQPHGSRATYLQPVPATGGQISTIYAPQRP